MSKPQKSLKKLASPFDLKQEGSPLKNIKNEQLSPTKTEEDEPNRINRAESSSEASSDDQKNEYEYDGFVVGDNEVESDKEEGQSPHSNPEKEKKLKRKRRKSVDLELEEEDLELIAEAEEEENKKDKHRRLKKTKMQREVPHEEGHSEEEISQIEDESEGQSFIEDPQGRSRKFGSEFNQQSELMRDFLYGKEIELPEGVIGESEETLVEKKKKTLHDIFEADEIEEKFATEEDGKIKTTDIPERLQLRYKKRPLVTTAELVAESYWILEKMKKLRCNPYSEMHRTKIYTALNNFRTNHLEVMFQAFYRKNELLPEINVNDLWEIYELDDEWGSFISEKEQIKKDMLVLENHMKISKSITDLFVNTFDKYHLDYIQDFIGYHLSKYVDPTQVLESEENKPTYKRPIKRLFAQEAIQLKLDQIARFAGLTADQLTENLQAVESGKMVHVPRYVDSTPEKISDDYRNPSNPLTIDTLSTMMNLCRYMANDIFYQPCIRNWVRNIYLEKVTICTEPTSKGKNDLEVTDPNYIVKRIYRRPIGLFTDDIWLRMMACENDGLIKIRFLLPWEHEKKEKREIANEQKDEIYTKLVAMYLAPTSAEVSETELEIIKQWNILRDEVLRIYLVQLMYPFLEKMLREDLRIKAEKYVARLCAEKFHNLLNIAPYMVEEAVNNNDDFEKKRKATMVAVVIDQSSSGKIGFVFADQNGEMIDHLILKFFAIPNGARNNPQISASFQKDKEEFDKFITKHKPDVIAISANCLEAKRIKQMIVDYKDTELTRRKENGEDIRIPWITYGDNIVPHLFSKTSKAEKEFKDFPPLIKEAISLARMMQNPMAEVLNLWSYKIEENPIFYIPFHPLQNSVNRSLLKKEYEKIAIEMVNNVGIDINEAIAHRHCANQLQFLSGLGPRKAAHFLEFMSNPNMLNVGVLRFRSEVYITKMFEKNVYVNVAGFLKIKTEQDVDQNGAEEFGKHEALDSTRIHPENYILAKKIARDALDEEVSENMQDWVPKIMKDAHKLKDLDLEDYANHLSTQKGKPNMIHVLRFIEKELACPFEDPRTGKKELENKDLFYRLCKENPLVFRPHCFVTVKIIKINNGSLLCKIIDNGLIGFIDKMDVFDKRENLGEDLGQSFTENQILRAKIKNINFENAINGDDQKKKKGGGDDLRVELTIKPSDMKITKSELKELFLNWEALEKHFRIIEEEDFPHFVQSSQKMIRYIPRKINHPKFKNISIAVAMGLLSDRSVGEYVIRPSSKGTDHLNITWKFYDKVIVHLDVREGPKNPVTLMANKFYIGKEQFESLDEIIEKYINRCNQYMKAISSHQKFKKGELDLIEAELIRDKQEDSKRIPYYFGCFESSPHYIVLCYLLTRNEIIKEYIKIKPGGLFFHNLYFTTLSSLILWFKENFKSPEYQRYLKKVKAPYSELEASNKLLGQGTHLKEDNDIWASSPGPQNDELGWDRAKGNEGGVRIKEEKIKDEKIKREISQKTNAICNTCGGVGHHANECVAGNKRGAQNQSSRYYDKGSYQNSRSGSQDKYPMNNRKPSYYYIPFIKFIFPILDRNNDYNPKKTEGPSGWGTMGQEETWASHDKNQFNHSISKPDFSRNQGFQQRASGGGSGGGGSCKFIIL